MVLLVEISTIYGGTLVRIGRKVIYNGEEWEIVWIYNKDQIEIEKTYFFNKVLVHPSEITLLQSYY